MPLPVVAVEGRVVADPELRFAPSGVAVGKFRIVADQKKNVDGEWVDDKVLWLGVTCFKALAENMVESVVKGDLVTVTGKLQTDSWETESGEKRSAVSLVADSVAVSLRFRTVKHGEGRASRQGGQGQSQQRQAEDPWATGPEQRGGFADDPPF